MVSQVYLKFLLPVSFPFLYFVDPRRTYFVVPPLGPPIVCSIKLNSVNSLYNLKKKVYSKTGIPPHLQHLFYSNQLIKDLDVLKTIPNEATIVQLICTVGGGNECNVCFDER